MKIAFLAVVLGVSASLSANIISFSPEEGYNSNILNGQPVSSANQWSCTTNNEQAIFEVRPTSTYQNRTGYLQVENSTVYGSGTVATTVDYASMDIGSVTTDFSAGFSFCMTPGSTSTNQKSTISLGESSDSGWGIYLGLNQNINQSISFHNGSRWVAISPLPTYDEWYDVEVDGFLEQGYFNITIYRSAFRSPNSTMAGLVCMYNHLAFRDTPESLNYVVISNEGSMQDTSFRSHLYDDLYIVPEPASYTILLLGGVLLRKRYRPI